MADRRHWQAEECPCLVERGAEIEAAIEGDEIEKVAMGSICSIGPFSGTWAKQTDIEAAARRSHDVAADPISPLAAAARQVMAAHGLGMCAETAREIGGARHLSSPIREFSEGPAVDECLEDGLAGFADGHEQAQFPGDDFAEQAAGLQGLDHAGGEAGQLHRGSRS